MKSKTKLFIFVWIILGFYKPVKADVDITESFWTTEQYIISQPYRTLRPCAWQYIIQVDIIATTGCNSMTMTLPTGIDFNIVHDLNITNLTLSSYPTITFNL